MHVNLDLDIYMLPLYCVIHSYICKLGFIICSIAKNSHCEFLLPLPEYYPSISLRPSDDISKDLNIDLQFSRIKCD